MQKTLAFVIRKTPIGEADYVVELFTREIGKLRCIAKGARKSKKRFGGRLEPFLELSVIIRESRRGMPLLTEVNVRQVFSSFQRDLGLFSWGVFVLETVDLLTPSQDPDPGIFDVAIETMQRLNDNHDVLETVMDFQLRALALAGYGIEPKAKSGDNEEQLKGIKALTTFTETQTGKSYKSSKFLEELQR